MSKEHRYSTTLTWTGNTGDGTKSYSTYKRLYEIKADNKPSLEGSSDPGFRGDPTKYNPEEMLLMSLSSCHMLWYLHLCSTNKIIVESYEDGAEGLMRENPDGSGEFTKVLLRPTVTISSGDIEKAKELHHDANKLCFIARSMNFPVEHEPVIRTVI